MIVVVEDREVEETVVEAEIVGKEDLIDLIEAMDVEKEEVMTVVIVEKEEAMIVETEEIVVLETLDQTRDLPVTEGLDVQVINDVVVLTKNLYFL